MCYTRCVQKILLPVIFFLIFLVIGGVCVLAYALSRQKAPSVVSSAFSLQNAPKDALIAQIISFSGNLLWESRTAVSPVPLTTSQPLQQGEELITTKSGSASVVFSGRVGITFLPSTDISFIQTLPQNIVLLQNSGTAVYTTSSPQVFSLRALGLLVESQTTASFRVTVTKTTVRITALHGTITLAYTDLQDKSVVTTLQNPQQAVFDDFTATLTQE